MTQDTSITGTTTGAPAGRTGDGNGMAVAGLVCGLVGLLFFPIILGPLALIFGGVGWSKANRGAKHKGMALAAVILGIADLGERFRFVSNAVTVVPPDQPLPNLPVARAVWRPEPDLRTSTEAWLTAGGPHHTVLSTALTTEHLDDLAEMTGTELVLIDADTTVRSLIRELRWNQAYHRLAAGM